jgi:hypothetical protein
MQGAMVTWFKDFHGLAIIVTDTHTGDLNGHSHISPDDEDIVSQVFHSNFALLIIQQDFSVPLYFFT